MRLLQNLRSQLVRLSGTTALTVAAVMSLPQSASAETKSYVVDWFYMANYYGGPEDCPQGLNPSSVEFYRRDFTRMGKPKEEVDRLLDGFPGPGFGPWSPVAIIRGDGKTNVYANPESAPDPGNFTIEGKYAWGFNLDGRGKTDKSFEDPVTHEAGIDNELFRTVGCIRSYRPSQPGARSVYSEYVWDVLRDRMPAWLITVDREGNEGSVTFDRALQTAPRDATGEHPRINMTFEVDPSSRAHYVVKGKFDGDTFTANELVPQINFMGDDFGLASDLSLRGARMKFTMNADGSLKGLVGGYQRWIHVYFAVASRGFSNEYVHSQDAPSVYYALKRGADANPDPKTGENRDISAAYMIEALPAKVIHPPAKGKPQLVKKPVIDAPLTTPVGITTQLSVKKALKRDATDEEKKEYAKLPTPPQMIYADAKGMTLYVSDKDTAGVSNCTAECAKTWLPALAPKDAKAYGDWSLIKRAEGRQWALRGKPLYTSVKDNEIGAVKAISTADLSWKAAAFVPGQGFVSPDGIQAAEVVGAAGIALVNDLGMPLYVFDGDAFKDKNACVNNGECLNRWKPVLAGQLSRAIGDFTVVESGQRYQWAFKGKPLFSFDGDTQPGDAVGAGLDRRWQVALVSKNFMPANVIVQRNHYEGFNLTTTDGMTIYQRDRWRSYNGGHSVRIGIKGNPSLGRLLGTAACVNNCLENWKPLIAPAKAQATGWWDIAVREDGTRQWVYQGYPVYTFNEDQNPGDMRGNEMIEYVGGYASISDPFAVAETGEVFAGPGAVGGVSGTAAGAMIWHSVLP
jgi:predicted lipoprotein with Yx(FWY)xxD motif